MAPCSSPGDRDQAADLRDSPPDFFTHDLDVSVLNGELDGAMHSAKDVPYPVPNGLDWFWLPWREDPRDAIVLRQGAALASMGEEFRMGVSSDRREAYCRERYPRATLLPIRGNIEKRLSQLDAGTYDAVMMAAAALIRLGLGERIAEWIPLAALPTPPGQGALALTFRQGDRRFLRLRSLFCPAVTFAGAGVGSWELCTLGAVEALKRCDVCLYDALLDPTVLEVLPASAERIDVGKRCGQHNAEQESINGLLTTYARQGRRVVRLKGGDPGIFGRLTEEIQALDAWALPYRVVPGVSSLNAATTGTGLVLTRAGGPRGFSAVTPRKRGGGLTAMDHAARARLPLVMFMAVGVRDSVARELMADGWPSDTPAAMVFGAGSDEETVVPATLATIAEETGKIETRQPGVLIVGASARSAFGGSWGAYEGKRVLLTCSDALLARAAGCVYDLGGKPVRRPLIRLTPSDEALGELERLASYDWLVLTSPSAARIFWGLLLEAQVDVRSLPRILVCGRRTAEELRRLGIEPDAIPDDVAGAASVAATARQVLRPSDKVLRLRSDMAGEGLAEQLRALVAEVNDVVLYRNAPICYDDIPDFDAAVFASSSAVASFISQWGSSLLVGKVVAAIGTPTHDALQSAGIAVQALADEMTIEATLLTLAAYCVRESIEGVEA